MTRLATLPAVARAAKFGSLDPPQQCDGTPPAGAPRRPPSGSHVAALLRADAPERDVVLHRRLADESRTGRAGDCVVATAVYASRLLPLPPGAGVSARRLERLRPVPPVQMAAMTQPRSSHSPRISARGLSPRKRLLQQEQTRRLQTLRARLKAGSYGLGSSSQNPWKLFSGYDRDNDGSLTLDEFTNAVRKDGKMNAAVMSDKELAQLFRAVDVDQSGQIDIQELTEFVWGKGATPEGIASGEDEQSTRPTRFARAEGSSTLASWRSTSVPAIRAKEAMTPRRVLVGPGSARARPRQLQDAGRSSETKQERQEFGVHPLWSKHDRPYAAMVDAGSFAFWFGKTGDPFVKRLPGSSFATAV